MHAHKQFPDHKKQRKRTLRSMITAPHNKFLAGTKIKQKKRKIANLGNITLDEGYARKAFTFTYLHLLFTHNTSQ